MAAEALARIAAGANPNYFGLIVNGLALDAYRRRAWETPVGDAQDVLTYVEAETIERAQFRAGFDQAVRRLGEPERGAFILTELRGLSEREAGAVLSQSQPTVHRRAEAARHLLQKELAT